MTGDSPAELAAYVGDPLIAEELRRCGRERGWTPWVPELPWHATAGFTKASLMTLVLDGTRVQKVVLKVVPASTDPSATDPRAYEWARSECPTEFLPHLVLQAEPAWPLPDGGTLLFQKIAGDDVTGCRSLAQVGQADLVTASRLIAEQLLTGWNGDSMLPGAGRLRPVRGRIGDFLRRVGGSGLSSSGYLRAWAQQARLLPEDISWIRFTDNTVFPNPMALACADSLFGAHTMEEFRGRGHGDLHLLNVLVHESDHLAGRLHRFQIIDLDGYRTDRPLTEDPVLLLLSGIVEILAESPVRDRESVLSMLADLTGAVPGEAAGGLVAAVFGTTTGIVRAVDKGWTQDWRLQFRLTMLATALRFTSFSNLGPNLRWWFFRLAAHLGRQILLELGIDLPLTGKPVHNPFPRWTRERPVDAPPLPDSAGRWPVDHLIARAWSLSDADEQRRIRELTRAHDRIVEIGESGKNMEACELQSRLWRDTAQVLGRRHPVTLSFQHNLAYWMAKSNQPAEAAALFREVAQARADTPELGPEHPDTIASREASMSFSLWFNATR